MQNDCKIIDGFYLMAVDPVTHERFHVGKYKSPDLHKVRRKLYTNFYEYFWSWIEDGKVKQQHINF